MKKLRLFGIIALISAMILSACVFESGITSDDGPDISLGGILDGILDIVGNDGDTNMEPPQEPEDNSSDKAPENADNEAENTVQNDLPENAPVYGEYYYDLTNVVLYLVLYDELPDNYITKDEARELGWTGGSVEDYLEGAAIGGDYFGNYEGLLPEESGRKYTECDIDTHGYGSRGSRRLVFSNDGLYFYTSDHYEHFSEVTVTADYEVIW